MTKITQPWPQQTDCPNSTSSTDDEGEHTNYNVFMQMNNMHAVSYGILLPSHMLY